jgi:hypothetical protein
LTGCTQSGETNGVISFTGCEINTAGVGYELHAIDGSLTAANSSAFNVTAGTATKLVFTPSPTNSVAGSALATQPKVTVEDTWGNAVTTDSSTASLSITSGTPTSGGPGTLTGCTQSGETNGVISFTGCEINTAGVGYELHATDGSLTAANSSAFNVTAGTATQLVFTTSPVAAGTGATFSTQPKVTVEDAYGNVVTSFSSAITLTASGGTLSSCGGLTASSGVVTVSSCKFSGTAGTSYTLTASYTGLTSATSASFTPTASGITAYKLVFTTSPVAGVSGAAFSTQPVVKVENESGYVVTSFSSAITLVASGGTLSSCGGLTASSGVVTVTGCTFTGTAGTPYTLTASSGTLISGTSASFSPTDGA